MELYQYLPLKSSRHIRLLNLQVGANDNPIVCALTQVSLDDNPVYEALSYTWDLEDNLQDTEKHSSIICDNKELFVAPNLYAALRQFRCPSGPPARRTIWIDAICINQKDSAERSQQVQIMHLIYAQANLVLVWLGEKEPADTISIRALNRIFECLGSESQGKNMLDTLREMMRVEDTSLPWRDPIVWASIESFFGKRWFSRVWVVQEIIMASNSLFICGDLEISWEILAKICAEFWQNGIEGMSQLRQGAQGIWMINFINQWKIYLVDEYSLELMVILLVTRPFGATIPRDRLYAFLGMIRQKSDPIFTPDYDTTNQRLYTRLAVYSLTKELSYFSLSLAQPSPSDLETSLPSWVPDWGCFPTTYKPFAGAVSFNTLATIPRSVAFTKNETTLHLRGIKFDAIKTIGVETLSNAVVHDNPEEQERHLARAAATCITEAEGLAISSFASHAYSVETLCRTLVTDNFEATPGFNTTVANLEASFYAYKELIRGISTQDLDKQWLDEYWHISAAFEKGFSIWGSGRFYGVTDQLRMGMFPKGTIPGDIICAIAGANTPFVIREQEDNVYKLVGECYVDGVMYGEISRLFDVQNGLVEIILR